MLDTADPSRSLFTRFPLVWCGQLEFGASGRAVDGQAREPGGGHRSNPGFQGYSWGQAGILKTEEYVGLTSEERETEWGRRRGFARLNMTEANRLERQHHMLREVQNALNE